MPGLVLWWVRRDQRLHDNPALRAACEDARQRGLPLLCLAPLPPDGPTRWGFSRLGPHRRWVEWHSLQALDGQLRRHGQQLWWTTLTLAQALAALPAGHPVVAVHAQQGLPLEFVGARVSCPSYYREGLPGESEAEYVARQTRLREEAKARMRAKFGGVHKMVASRQI